MTYNFRYKRGLFWKTIPNCTGNQPLERPRLDMNGHRIFFMDKDGNPIKDQFGNAQFETEYDIAQDKMMVWQEDGTVNEISQWSKCDLRLGQDFILFKKDLAEKQTNMSIPLNIKKK